MRCTTFRVLVFTISTVTIRWHLDSREYSTNYSHTKRKTVRYRSPLTKRRTGSSVVERRIAIRCPIILMSRVRSSFSPFFFFHSLQLSLCLLCLHRLSLQFMASTATRPFCLASPSLALPLLHCRLAGTSLADGQVVLVYFNVFGPSVSSSFSHLSLSISS